MYNIRLIEIIEVNRSFMSYFAVVIFYFLCQIYLLIILRHNLISRISGYHIIYMFLRYQHFYDNS